MQEDRAGQKMVMLCDGGWEAVHGGPKGKQVSAWGRQAEKPA